MRLDVDEMECSPDEVALGGVATFSTPVESGLDQTATVRYFLEEDNDVHFLDGAGNPVKNAQFQEPLSQGPNIVTHSLTVVRSGTRPSALRVQVVIAVKAGRDSGSDTCFLEVSS